MYDLDISPEVEKFIQQKLRWRFWLSKPAITLIEFGKCEKGKFSLARDSSNLLKLVPLVRSAKRLPDHYLADSIRMKNYILIPHIKMILYAKGVKKWQLKSGQDSLVLLADGVVVSGIPNEE